MKYLTFILSIYTICLVSAPCVDEVLPCNILVSEQTDHQHSGAPSDHSDACSPFCICSCCSVPVTIAQNAYICHPFFAFQRSIIAGSSQFISSFTVNFWQPPKIS